MRQALDQVGHPDTPVTFVSVDPDTAVTGFSGSPTFTINGLDLFAAAAAPSGVSCRLYQTATGPAGVPSVAELVAALRGRTAR
jgi:hypothetical protein